MRRLEAKYEYEYADMRSGEGRWKRGWSDATERLGGRSSRGGETSVRCIRIYVLTLGRELALPTPSAISCRNDLFDTTMYYYSR